MAYFWDDDTGRFVEVPFHKRRGRKGRVVRYPWHLWLDGSLWSLEPGKDFECSVATFRSIVHNQAGRRMIQIRVSQVSENRITIQKVGIRTW